MGEAISMTKEVFYKKVGKRYIPVSEYDSEWSKSFTEGAHLVVVEKPGVTSYKYNIQPNYAALIAAGRVAEEMISKTIMDATELRFTNKIRAKDITPEQRAAWERLVELLGPEAQQLEWPSAREAAQRAVKVLEHEAEKLLNVPAVKKAYEHFMFVAALTKDENEPKS